MTALISDPRLQELWNNVWAAPMGSASALGRQADEAFILALNERLAANERTLERHGRFRDAAVALVRDMRLAIRQGDYLSKQEMDTRSDAWLKDVDGPRPTAACRAAQPNNLETVKRDSLDSGRSATQPEQQPKEPT